MKLTFSEWLDRRIASIRNSGSVPPNWMPPAEEYEKLLKLYNEFVLEEEK